MELVNIPTSQIDPFYRYKRNKVELDFIRIEDSDKIDGIMRKLKIFSLFLKFVASHGGQTEILNLNIIAGQLNRDVEILARHIKKSLNMNLTKFKGIFRLPVQVNTNTIDNSIEDFVKRFVICKECGNPEIKNKELSETLFRIIPTK